MIEVVEIKKSSKQQYQEEGLSIGEMERIDNLMNAMNEAYLKRALTNVPPKLLLNEVNRRFNTLMKSVEEINAITRKYEVKSWDLMTIWEMLEDYKAAVGNIRK